MASFGLVTPFLTDDPAFALGVEYGMLFVQLQRARARKRLLALIHEANEERVRLMVGRLGWTIARRRSDQGGWVMLTLRHANRA